MNRRAVLKMAGAAGLVAILPKTAFGEELPPGDNLPPADPRLEVTAEIGNNHGHDLTLTAVQVLQNLRMTKDGVAMTLDIQGGSRHPHAIEMVHADWINLLVEGAVTKDSTLVANHTHPVTIRLEII